MRRGLILTYFVLNCFPNPRRQFKILFNNFEFLFGVSGLLGEMYSKIGFFFLKSHNFLPHYQKLSFNFILKPLHFTTLNLPTPRARITPFHNLPVTMVFHKLTMPLGNKLAMELGNKTSKCHLIIFRLIICSNEDSCPKAIHTAVGAIAVRNPAEQ